jgi:DeoR/GlpR family transcriptional regulator of sugar metabolism
MSERIESSPRFAQERQAQIAQVLREQGRVEVAELALRFGLSEDSIRRDLRLLVTRGLARKTHGGAVALHLAPLPAAERNEVAVGAKRAIAAAALAHVQPHQTLLVDGGSTTLAFAQALRGATTLRPLTVLTASFDVLAALVGEPQLNLVLAGGRWEPSTRTFMGAQGIATLQGYRADLALLGACALHPKLGLTSIEAEDAAFKRAMIETSALCIVLADASKLGTVAPHAVCALSALDRVICDASPDWLAAAVAVERVDPSPR